MHDYIISYGGGAAGRFVNSIILKIINNLNEQVVITKENSAHQTMDSTITTINLPARYNYKKDSYLTIKWNREHYSYCTLWSHQPPNFEHIRKNPELSNTHIIFIQLKETNIVEVASNLAYKAYIPKLKDYQAYTKVYDKVQYIKIAGILFSEVSANLARLSGKDIDDIDPDSIDTIEMVKDIILTSKVQENHIRSFLNIDIPDDFKHRVFIIEYDDLKSSVGLEKIKSITNNDLSSIPEVTESYFRYIDGQRKMVNEKLIWI